MKNEQHLITSIIQQTPHTLDSLSEILDLSPEELCNPNSDYCKQKISMLKNLLEEYGLIDNYSLSMTDNIILPKYSPDLPGLEVPEIDHTVSLAEESTYIQ